MTRDDLKQFCGMKINFAAVGLMDPGVPQVPCFCDPVNGEPVGRLGCDGVHFILLPGDERVFCVDPAMGEPGTYVLPVAQDFRQFLSFVLFCGDAGPISQIWWMEESQFRALLAGEKAARPEQADLLRWKEETLRAVAAAFRLEPVDPYGPVRALQADFDPTLLRFFPSYYDAVGLEVPQTGGCAK